MSMLIKISLIDVKCYLEIFFIYCDKSTSTYYDDLEVENNNGEMILFPSYVPHCTSKYEGDDCRISIAFDIYSEKGFELGINSNVRNHWKKI